jgi:hypothetical protein
MIAVATELPRPYSMLGLALILGQSDDTCSYFYAFVQVAGPPVSFIQLKSRQCKEHSSQAEPYY